MGVEIDQYSRPVAYHLYKGPNHPYGAAEYYRTDRHTRIPADNIIHLYHPERAQQTRGVPLFASVLNKIQMLDGYEEAELVASRLAASKSLFLKSEQDESYPSGRLSRHLRSSHGCRTGIDYDPFLLESISLPGALIILGVIMGITTSQFFAGSLPDWVLITFH